MAGNPSAPSGVTGLNITVNQPGVRLVGECGEPGQSNAGVGAGTPSNCSTIVSDQAITMLIVGTASGNPGSFYSGLVIDNLGFRDTSTNFNQVLGAIDLVNTEDFALYNVSITDLAKPASPGPGAFGILFDGSGPTSITDGNVTQFGVVVNPTITSTTFPLQSRAVSSEITVLGGSLSCPTVTVSGNTSVVSGTIGVDLGSTYHFSSAASTGGEWEVFGTHVLNCATGVSMWDNGPINWEGFMEQTGLTPPQQGTGFLVSGDLTGSSAKAGVVIGGSINSFSLGVSTQGDAVDNTITATITNTGTATGTQAPLEITSAAVASALILSNFDYGAGASGSGLAVGSQIPTDLTLSLVEALPPKPTVTNSRLLYLNSSAAGDATVEKTDASTVDLENHGVTTGGDMLYANTASPPLLVRLGIGTTGQCLTTNGSVPQWTACGTIGSSDMTGQNSSIGPFTIATTGVARHYLINIEVSVTTAGSSATVEGTVNWTGDSVSKSRATGTASFASTGAVAPLTIAAYIDSGVAVTYTTTVSGSPGAGQYAVHAWLVQQ